MGGWGAPAENRRGLRCWTAPQEPAPPPRSAQSSKDSPLTRSSLPPFPGPSSPLRPGGSSHLLCLGQPWWSFRDDPRGPTSVLLAHWLAEQKSTRMGHHPRHSARARPGAVRTTLPSWQRDKGCLLAARWQGSVQGSEVRQWPGGGSGGLRAGLWQPPAGLDSGLCWCFSQFISQHLIPHCEAHPVKTQKCVQCTHRVVPPSWRWF